MKGSSRFLPIVVIIVLAIAMRVALLAADVVPFDGDEAVVALMARAIRSAGANQMTIPPQKPTSLEKRRPRVFQIYERTKRWSGIRIDSIN